MYGVFCKKNRQSGIISSNGKILFPFRKRAVSIGAVNEGLVFCEQGGKLFAVTDNGDRINYNGKKKPEGVVSLPIFQDGLAVVSDMNTDKCGYVNKAGSWVIPALFELASEFHDGLAMVFNCDSQRTYEMRGGERTLIRATVENPMYGIIDRTGQLLCKLPIDEVPMNQSGRGWPDDMFEFVGLKTIKGNRQMLCVVRNCTDVVLFPDAKELRPCYRGMVGCRIVKNRRSNWELRTTRNVLVVKDKFENLGFWGSGLCPAKARGQGWGALDINGRWVIAPKYDHLGMFCHGLAVGESGGRFIVISPDDQVIMKCKADYVWIYPDRILVVKGNRIQLYDFQGKLLHTIQVN